MQVILLPLPRLNCRQTERTLIQARVDSHRKWAKRRARLRLRRDIGRLLRKMMPWGARSTQGQRRRQVREALSPGVSGE